MNIFKASLNKIYQPPGTLIYTGKTPTKSSIELIEYNQDEFYFKTLSSSEEFQAKENLNSWIDFTGFNDLSLIEDTGKKFNIHKLLLEDILNTNHNSKIEFSQNNIFTILKIYSYKDSILQKEQLSLFFTANTLISFRETDSDLFNTLKERIKNNEGVIRSKNTEYLLFSIFDYLIDNYHILMSKLQEQMENIEFNLFDKEHKKKIQNIYSFRTDIIKVKNTVSHLTEIISKLKDRSSEEYKIFYSDIEDKLSLYLEELKYNEEKCKSLIEIYVAVNGDKMNEIMKVLTIVSTIFIPLSFIAGLYGMNFEYIPELKLKYGYFGVLALMFIIVLTMISFIRKKDWF